MHMSILLHNLLKIKMKAQKNKSLLCTKNHQWTICKNTTHTSYGAVSQTLTKGPNYKSNNVPLMPHYYRNQSSSFVYSYFLIIFMVRKKEFNIKDGLISNIHTDKKKKINLVVVF